jgi:hypothetical protein
MLSLFQFSYLAGYYNNTYQALIRKRNMPTEWPQIVGEVSANSGRLDL